MVVRRKRARRTPKMKPFNMAMGKGNYRITARTQKAVLRTADKVDRVPGVTLSRPKLYKPK